MLGIRYINDTAIDIWVGMESDFITDIKSSSNIEDIKGAIIQAQNQKLRHLGIIIGYISDNNPSFKEKILEIFSTIKYILENESKDYPKRITLILDRKEDYYTVQDIMFKTILKR